MPETSFPTITLAQDFAAPSSLCFYDAAVALKKNTITEDEYLQALLAHCSGLRHGQNQLCNGDDPEALGDSHWQHLFGSNVVLFDNFAANIKNFIAFHVTEKNPAHDTTPLFRVLKAFRADDEAEFRAGINQMDETYKKQNELPFGTTTLTWGLCYFICTRAVREKKIGVIKPILEICYESTDILFETCYDGLKQDPENNRELLRIIDESGYKSMVPLGKRLHDIDILDRLPH